MRDEPEDGDDPIDIEALAESRRWMMEQVREHAAFGNEICGSLLSIASSARLDPWGDFITGPAMDYDEDDSDFGDGFDTF